MQMRVLEFKLKLTRQQQQQIDQWLEVLKVVWNRGLALLEWRQYHRRYQQCLQATSVSGWEFDLHRSQILTHKVGEDWALYCPCAAEFRVDRTQGREIAGNLELRPVVNLVKPHWLEPPLIDGASAISLRKPFAKKRWQPPHEIPMVYLNDFITVLASAWEQYQKGVRARPRYKRRRDRVQTVPCDQVRSQVLIQGRQIRLPGLGWLSVKGLDTRLSQPLAELAQQMMDRPDDYPQLAKLQKKGKSLEQAIDHATTPGSLSICRKAKGYFLQVTTPLPGRSRHALSRRSAVGLAAGANAIYTASTGHAAAPAMALQQVEAKILSQQQRLSARKGRKYPPQPGSKNYAKRQQQIAKLHERAARSRRAHAHWHSTGLTDVYGEIAYQQLDLPPLTARPDPVVAPEGDHYEKNGAERKSEVNRAFTEAAGGQFRALIANKSSARGRQAIPVSSRFLQQQLGEIPNNRIALARAILAIYPGASGELTPVELTSESALNQEAAAATPGPAEQSADTSGGIPDNRPKRHRRKRRKVLAEVEKAALPQP